MHAGFYGQRSKGLPRLENFFAVAQHGQLAPPAGHAA